MAVPFVLLLLLFGSLNAQNCIQYLSPDVAYQVASSEKVGQQFSVSDLTYYQWNNATILRNGSTPIWGTFYIVPGTTSNTSNYLFSTPFYSVSTSVFVNGTYNLPVEIWSDFTFLWVREDGGAPETWYFASSDWLPFSSGFLISSFYSFDIVGQFCFSAVPPSPSVTPSTSVTPSPSPSPFSSGPSFTWNWESNYASQRAGARITKCDVNGDTYTDLIVTGQMSAYAFYGSSNGTFGASPSWTVNVSLTTTNLEGLGLECADVNSDGFADVIIGNWTANPGYVHIYNGSYSGLSYIPQSISYAGAGSYFGEMIHVNDFDNDGKKDLAVGAYGAGRVNIYYQRSGTWTSYTPSFLAPVLLTFGEAITSGDFSGDGYPDLVVSCRSCSSNLGQVSIFSVNSTGFSPASWVVNGTTTASLFGYDVTTGDFNGDNKVDLAVLSNGDKFIYIYYGTGNLATLPKTPSLQISVTDTCRVIKTGDVNFDSFDDILVGCSSALRVRLFYGSASLSSSTSPAITITGTAATTGFSVAFLGNLDGVGLGEIAWGAWTYTNGQTAEGQVTVSYNTAPSPSPSVTSPSITPSNTPSNTPSPSVTPTASVAPSLSPSASVSSTVTPSISVSSSPLASSSQTPSTSSTPSNTPSPSPSVTPTPTPIITFGSYWNWESNYATQRAGARITKCDVNGDSYTDLIVTGQMSAYAFYGDSNGAFGASPSWSVNVTFTVTNLEGLGLECADVNSDGYDDVLVGNWTANPGYVHIFNGSASGLAYIPQSISYSGSGAYFGEMIHVNDFNNDGKKDIAVGAYGTGRVIVYYQVSGSWTSYAPSFLYPVLLTFGEAITSGDFSGDGYPDLVVSCRSCASNMGQVSIFSVNSTGFSPASWIVNGTTASQFFGYDVATGDFNGDSKTDLAVLSNGDKFIYIYYGTGDLTTLPTSASVKISVTDTCRVIKTGDINFDSFDDILVGCSATLRVRLFYGSASLSSSTLPAVTVTGTSANTGFSVAFMGNLDGVGLGEIAWGAWTYTNGQTAEGQVTVSYGLAPSPSPSVTPSISASPATTPSNTPSPSVTPTASVTPSGTPSASVSPTVTPSVSATATVSVTPTMTPTTSPTPTPSSTASVSPSSSPSPTPSPTLTPSATPTSSVTPSSSPSPVPSTSPTASTQPSTACSECASNADCGNGQGVCVTSDFGRYCSCLSGFGGCDCTQTPWVYCNSSYSQVDALSGNFQANATVDYVYPMLFVTVNANLEESIYGNGGSYPTNSPPYSTETLVFFGSSSSLYPACSYPNGGYTWIDFAAQPGMCYDKYLSNMTWSFAKDNCGFVAENGTRNYAQTVTIQRRYNLNGILQRTEQTTRSLNVIFPTEIPATDSNVTVSFPTADASAAITFIDYNPDTQFWTVEVQTTISPPYSLSTPSLVSLTGSLAQREPIVSVTGCSIVGSQCVQTITYAYPQGSVSDACLGLIGQDHHSFAVTCSLSSCPAAEDFNITLRLNTGNACPATDLIQFSESTLTSYSNAALTTQTDSFTINDLVYFGASIQSTEALISSRSLGANAVCFQPSSGPCFYVNYTILLPTNGKDPVFVVDLNGPGNAGYFQSITESTQFSVSATVQVNFVGAKGLLKNRPQTQTVQTSSLALIGPGSDSTISSSSLIAPMMSLILLMLLL